MGWRGTTCHSNLVSNVMDHVTSFACSAADPDVFFFVDAGTKKRTGQFYVDPGQKTCRCDAPPWPLAAHAPRPSCLISSNTMFS